MRKAICAALLGVVTMGIVGCSRGADTQAAANETILLNDEGGALTDAANVSPDDPGANLFDDAAAHAPDASNSAALANAL